MTTNLKDEFQELWNSKNPVQRGILFEELFCRLLFKSGFVVHKNPDTAKPRQTDLLAEYGDDTFLFEIKWLERKVDIDAIGQIKDRLSRTSKDTIGCICSASGFTETLIQDVEQIRSQFEVLLFNPYEIYEILERGTSILDLIDNKRRSLRRDGTVWFFDQTPRNSRSRYVELPPSHETLQLRNSSIHMQLESEHISDIVFARTHLIFNEYLWAVSLRLRLDSTSVEKLREVFIAAENCLGLRGTGAFGIRQKDSGWYGLGSENFLKEIARYARRYKNYRGNIHHSEELAFFDDLSEGLFFLNARQSMTRKRWIHSGEITIRLPGIPSDLQPYLKFIRSITRDNVFFTPEQPLRRHYVALPSTVRVALCDVITKIGSKELRDEAGCISGIILRNPFFRDSLAISKLTEDEELLAFAEPEYLICTLDHWLNEGDEVDYYVLTGLETVAIGETVLLHPRCTWGNLTKRAPQPPKSNFLQLDAKWKYRDRMIERLKKASKRKSGR